MTVLVGLMTLAGLNTAAPAAGAIPALVERYRQAPEHWPAPWIEAGVPFVELAAPPRPAPPSPRERQLAALGQRLFDDPLLSVNGTVACASCHRPDQGWSLASASGPGATGERGRRNPPDLRQAAAHRQWGWDGRASSLVAQALAPLTDPLEMANADLDTVLRRIATVPAHGADFRRHYGVATPTAEQLGEVLAAWVRSLGREAPPSRFARFLAGDHQQLSAREIEGLHLFRTRARCANCHFGPWLSDGHFHNLRLSSYGEPAEDLGRYAATGLAADVGRFRTPSLHYLAQSAPFMHNGLFPHLEGVIRFYRRGGGEVWARNAREAADPLFPHAARRSPLLRALDLSEDEIGALAAFLRTL